MVGDFSGIDDGALSGEELQELMTCKGRLDEINARVAELSPRMARLLASAPVPDPTLPELTPAHRRARERWLAAAEPIKMELDRLKAEGEPLFRRILELTALANHRSGRA